MKKRKIFLFSIFILIIFSLYYFGFFKHFSLENFKKNRVILQELVLNNYVGSVAIFMGIFIFLTALAIPVAFLLTLISGFLFGPLYGAIYSSLSAAIGSTIAFLFIRYIAGNWMKRRFKNSLESFRQGASRYGYSYILTMHFSAVVPLFMVNIFASLAGIKLWTFFWTTAVGTLPAFFVYAFAGMQLSKVNSFVDVFTPKILLAFLFLAMLVSMPIIIRRFRKKTYTC